MMTTRVSLALILVAAAATRAHAACPDGRANCLLHEEGVALLTSGKFEEAAAKFQASLAAGATARAALGYAQAIEGQGKVALAYESMLYAKQLSDAELAGPDGKSVEIIGRSQRVQYKLGELRAKVGFVQVTLPTNVSPRRLVSLRRRGEGDLVDPLTRWVVVAPDRQVLIAALDDGSKIEVDAQVAAGMQGKVVIPIPTGTQQARPNTNPGRDPNAGRVVSRPLADLYPKPEPVLAQPPPALALGLDIVTLVPNPTNLTSGIGASLLLEKRLGKSIGMTARLSFVSHPESTFFDPTLGDVSFSGRELMALVGLRTASKYSFHAFAEAGLTAFTMTASATGRPMLPPLAPDDFINELYPTLAIGGATRLGRVHLQLGLVYAIATGDVELPVRFMASLGVDLVKK
ncbi:MAG: hypothetical protein KF773_34915 [Deltaproteobacteria bacterium]|nr:hypothetical protein [Deltaproteobacteria bacterium]